jgi:rod shape determining protein RodA
MLIDRRLVWQFDWLLLAITFLIPLISLVVLYSAGYEADGAKVSLWFYELQVFSPAFIRQLFNLLLGLLALLFGLSLSPKLLFRIAPFFYIIGVILLVGVLQFGEVANGARRWLDIGGVRIQPAEFMKFSLVLYLARVLNKLGIKEGGYTLKELLYPATILAIPFFLIVVQPDLGTALALGGIGVGMLLFAGIRLKLFLLLLILPNVIFIPIQLDPYKPLAFSLLKPYQQRRVAALLDPSSDIQGSGWHIHQSKIAVGSGQITGKGFMQGSQTQLLFLPEHTTDFIFSVLAEEWGFIGCTLVLLLYVALIYRILHVVHRARDSFLAFIAFGYGTQIFIHVLVNVGMVIGLLPVVGIPLPLFSYGGTSVVSVLFGIGLVLGVAMRRNVHINHNIY